MKKFGSFVLGAVLGGFIGATLATLFAPMSGNVLREKIQEQYQSVRTEVNDAAAEKPENCAKSLPGSRNVKFPQAHKKPLTS